MSESAPIPPYVQIPMASLVQLAIETWRLTTWMAAQPSTPSSSAPARHALRKLEDFCRQNGIEPVSLNGKPYDPGMAVRVIDLVKDPTLPPGTAIIAQTLSPLILWHDQVIKPAEIIAHQG